MDAVRNPGPDTGWGLLTADDFGADWPFTVPWVLVDCHRIGAGEELYAITLIDPAGIQYSANSVAASRTGNPFLHPIWRDAAQHRGLKMDLGPVLAASIDLCG